MNELHPLGVTEEFRHRLEEVDPRFIKEGILSAREKSWQVYDVIKKEIKPGLTEKNARELARKIFLDYGVKKHWHQPSIRFGAGTVSTFHSPLREQEPLEDGQPAFMDLGPVWFHEETQMEYEGDVGDSFVIGENVEATRCVQAIKTLFEEGRAKWLKEKCSGEVLYQYLDQRTQGLGYRLLQNVVGHRLGDFPHQKYTKIELPKIEFTPNAFLWILELQIVHPTLSIGAFYEDLLF